MVRRAGTRWSPNTDPVGIFSEATVGEVVDFMVRVVEMAGALIIFVGCVLAFARFVVVGLRERRIASFVRVRLDLGRMLALGLEFQLASDILRTAVSPTLQQIAELAAVAGIRTALNYFLAREIRQERDEIARDREQGQADGSRTGGHLA